MNPHNITRSSQKQNSCTRCIAWCPRNLKDTKPRMRMMCSPGKAKLKSIRLPVTVWNNTSIYYYLLLSTVIAALQQRFTWVHVQTQCLYVSKSSLRPWICCGTPAGPHPQTRYDSITKKSLNKDFPFSMKQATSCKYHSIHSVLAFAKSAAPWSPEPWPAINSFRKC